LEKYCNETFKSLEDIHDELVRLEGTGGCGTGEVLKSFSLKIKSFEA
jgi:hypothetical protein